jgi:hypothetical protein
MANAAAPPDQEPRFLGCGLLDSQLWRVGVELLDEKWSQLACANRAGELLGVIAVGLKAADLKQSRQVTLIGQPPARARVGSRQGRPPSGEGQER